MSILGIAALSVYGLGWLGAARLIAGNVAYDMMWSDRDSPEMDDWAVGCALGLMFGLVWPLAAVVKLFVLIPIRGPEETRARQRQHEKELRERAERRRQLERDLGIGE